MLTCFFEDNKKVFLRHITAGGIIYKNNQILLVKRANHLLEAGKWCPPGGYLDRDENLMQGTLREIKEETGYEGKIISLFRINSNPNRPKEDRQNVDSLLGFLPRSSAASQIKIKNI